MPRLILPTPAQAMAARLPPETAPVAATQSAPTPPIVEPFEGYRKFNLTLKVVEPSGRDRFHSLSRPDTFREIRPGRGPGQRGAYSVEMTYEEYQQAFADVADSSVNLIAVEPPVRVRKMAVPDAENLAYINATGQDGTGARIGIVDDGLTSAVASVMASQIISGMDVTPSDSALSSPPTTHDHGSFIAGIAVPPGAQFAMAKVFADDSSTSDDYEAAGLYWLADEVDNIHVINVSLGSESSTTVLSDAVAHVLGQGIIICASAGNSGTNALEYPASYPGVLKITNYDRRTDAKAPSSNFGNDVFMAAPGCAVTSYDEAGAEEYTEDGGTSGASAFNTRGIALEVATGKSPSAARNALAANARSTGAGGAYEGYGVLRFLEEPVADPVPPLEGTGVPAGDPPTVPPWADTDPETGKPIEPSTPLPGDSGEGEGGGGLSSFVQMESNDAGTVALDSDGKVWAWGLVSGIDPDDELRPYRAIQYHAVTVMGMDSCVDVAASGGDTEFNLGYAFACVKDDGTLWWFGQGDVTPDDTLNDGPVQIGSHADITSAIFVGEALIYFRADGSTWGAGNGEPAAYGLDPFDYSGWTPPYGTPFELTNFPENISYVASGPVDMSALVTSDGSVWAWGYNGSVLGELPGTDTFAPTQVAGIDDAASVAVQQYALMAVTTSGSVKVWGYASELNSFGFDISETFFDGVESPTEIPGLANITGISTWIGRTVARDSAGAVWGWGGGGEGFGVAEPFAGSAVTEASPDPVIIREDGAGPVSIGRYVSMATDTSGHPLVSGFDDDYLYAGHPIPESHTDIDGALFLLDPVPVKITADGSYYEPPYNIGTNTPTELSGGTGTYTAEEQNAVRDIVYGSRAFNDGDRWTRGRADLKSMLEDDRGSSFESLFADEIATADDTQSRQTVTFWLKGVKVQTSILQHEDWTSVSWGETFEDPGTTVTPGIVLGSISGHNASHAFGEPGKMDLGIDASVTIVSWSRKYTIPSAPFYNLTVRIQNPGTVFGEPFLEAMSITNSGSWNSSVSSPSQAERFNQLIQSQLDAHPEITGNPDAGAADSGFSFESMDIGSRITTIGATSGGGNSAPIHPDIPYDNNPFNEAFLLPGFEDLSLGGGGLADLPPMQPDPIVAHPTAVKINEEPEKFPTVDVNLEEPPADLKPGDPFDVGMPDGTTKPFNANQMKMADPSMDPCNSGMPAPGGGACGSGNPADTPMGQAPGTGGAPAGFTKPGGTDLSGVGQGAGAGSQESKYFKKDTCFKNEEVNVIIVNLATLLKLDPSKVQVNPDCDERYTGCFKKGSNIFDALKKMAALCGGVFNPGDGGGVVTPPSPLDVHHTLSEYRDIFYLERLYDNQDNFAKVEVYRPPKIVNGEYFPGVSKQAEVVTPFEPDLESVKVIYTYDYNLTDAQIQNMVNVEAAKTSGTGARCQITIPYRVAEDYKLYHQVHIERPSINWFTRWMVRTIEWTFSTNGHLIVMEMTYLANEGVMAAAASMNDVLLDPVNVGFRVAA